MSRCGILGVAFGLAAVTVGASGSPAQSVPRVTLGFGVDTTAAAWSELSWHSSVPDIFRAWREYLSNEPGRLTPNPRWSSEEQERWSGYDLTAGAAHHGASATVLDIRPAGNGMDRPGPAPGAASPRGNAETVDGAPKGAGPEPVGEFVVKTLFSRVAGDDRSVKPIALTRVYAVREEGRWVFGNALPRLTADWERVVVGPIEYVVQPGLAVDRAGARRAVAFADSVAADFEVPPLEHLTYFMASGPEEVQRLMGMDWTFGSTRSWSPTAPTGVGTQPARSWWTSCTSPGARLRCWS